MADPAKTDPKNQNNPNKTPTIKDQAKSQNSKNHSASTGDKVDLTGNANPSKPNEVHGHNVNRTGPGGSK